MTYILFKRETCPECKGSRVNPQWLTPDSYLAIAKGKSLIPVEADASSPIHCPTCEGDGCVSEPVDLLDVLKKISWGRLYETSDGSVVGTSTFENLRIEE